MRSRQATVGLSQLLDGVMKKSFDVIIIAGVGLAGLSIGEGTQAWNDRSDAIDNFHKASDEVEELFSSIRDHVNNKP